MIERPTPNGEDLVRETTELLALYAPTRLTVTFDTGETAEHSADNPALQTRFETAGVAPLAALLHARPDVSELRLEGDGVVVSIKRESAQEAVLSVAWKDGADWNETLAIEGSAVHGGSQRGQFTPSDGAKVGDPISALHDPLLPLWVTQGASNGANWYQNGAPHGGPGSQALLGHIPAVDPRTLGAASFREEHGVDYAYVAGAMAGGIASVELVTAMSKANMLAFFGAGGLPLEVVEKEIARLKQEIGTGPGGANLLHNPVEPDVEDRTVDIYLKHGINTVSASAYMTLTAPIVRYRLTGIEATPSGEIHCPNKVFAKVSRPEVAEHFLKPAPENLLRELVSSGAISESQAKLAEQIPIAGDITAEADSGGHTDRRPFSVLVPMLVNLRDQISEAQGYAQRDCVPRVGAAGGIGTPQSICAALRLGADYVLTGSVNQSTLEAGTSPLVKEMLAQAGLADCVEGPAPDMFEMGAKVQVLGKGSMYAQRAGRLYDLYRNWDRIEDIPEKDRKRIEKQIFRRPLDEVWTETVSYWKARDPEQLARAERDPHHKMALIFRWYLGLTSRWARIGENDRQRDFQIWCGPSMGGFNDWVRGSHLEAVENRTVVAVAHALLRGAAALERVHCARTLGLKLDRRAWVVSPSQ